MVFGDTVNVTCAYGNEVKTTEHFFLALVSLFLLETITLWKNWESGLKFFDLNC